MLVHREPFAKGPGASQVTFAVEQKAVHRPRDFRPATFGFHLPGFDGPVDKGLNVEEWDVLELSQLAKGTWESSDKILGFIFDHVGAAIFVFTSLLLVGSILVGWGFVVGVAGVVGARIIRVGPEGRELNPWARMSRRHLHGAYVPVAIIVNGRLEWWGDQKQTRLIYAFQVGCNG